MIKFPYFFDPFSSLLSLMISVCRTRTRGAHARPAPLLILHLSLPFPSLPPLPPPPPHLRAPSPHCLRLRPLNRRSSPGRRSVARVPWPLSSPALGGSASAAGELTGDPPGPGGKGGGSLCPLEVSQLVLDSSSFSSKSLVQITPPSPFYRGRICFALLSCLSLMRATICP